MATDKPRKKWSSTVITAILGLILLVVGIPIYLYSETMPYVSDFHNPEFAMALIGSWSILIGSILVLISLILFIVRYFRSKRIKHDI